MASASAFAIKNANVIADDSLTSLTTESQWQQWQEFFLPLHGWRYQLLCRRKLFECCHCIGGIHQGRSAPHVDRHSQPNDPIRSSCTATISPAPIAMRRIRSIPPMFAFMLPSLVKKPVKQSLHVR
jgi:hypothetical protein